MKLATTTPLPTSWPTEAKPAARHHDRATLAKWDGIARTPRREPSAYDVPAWYVPPVEYVGGRLGPTAAVWRMLAIVFIVFVAALIGAVCALGFLALGIWRIFR